MQEQHTPSPTVEPHNGQKAKKAIGYGLLTGGVIFVLAGLPSLASAGAFSLNTVIQATASNTHADSSAYNSQTIPLLAAATNIDPNPIKNTPELLVVAATALAAKNAPSAGDTEVVPTSSQVSVYTVHTGDSLGQIAQMFDVTVNTIIWANDIKNGVIHPGDTLIILPVTGIRHTLASKETLASLAKKFNANADDIAQYNGLDPSAPLAAGTTIIIPNGELSAGASSGSASSGSKHAKHGAGAAEPYLGGSGAPIPGYFAWPVAGGLITQGLHGWNAVDIGASRGTSIYAAADGTVIVARDNGGWNGGYGNYIVIEHQNGTQTLYAHASKVLVSPGEVVSQGQTIAQVGETGMATGPHLHFEVRGAQNPFASLPMGATE